MGRWALAGTNCGLPQNFDQFATGLVGTRSPYGADRRLPVALRPFLYMPLMHAEDLRVQDASVALFED